MTSKIPGMMLWTDAYLADTGHLSTAEHGAYLLLLIAMWRNGASLPNDPAKLARFARLRPDQWSRMAPTILKFFIVEGERITQKRLLREFEKSMAYVASRVRLGKLGAEAKALKSGRMGLTYREAPVKHLKKELRVLPSRAAETGFATRMAEPLSVSSELRSIIGTKP